MQTAAEGLDRSRRTESARGAPCRAMAFMSCRCSRTTSPGHQGGDSAGSVRSHSRGCERPASGANARPQGFVVKTQVDAPMHLLEPRRHSGRGLGAGATLYLERGQDAAGAPAYPGDARGIPARATSGTETGIAHDTETFLRGGLVTTAFMTASFNAVFAQSTTPGSNRRDRGNRRPGTSDTGGGGGRREAGCHLWRNEPHRDQRSDRQGESEHLRRSRFGLRTGSVQAGGDHGNLDGLVQVSFSQRDGFRAHPHEAVEHHRDERPVAPACQRARVDRLEEPAGLGRREHRRRALRHHVLRPPNRRRRVHREDLADDEPGRRLIFGEQYHTPGGVLSSPSSGRRRALAVTVTGRWGWRGRRVHAERHRPQKAARNRSGPTGRGQQGGLLPRHDVPLRGRHQDPGHPQYR